MSDKRETRPAAPGHVPAEPARGSTAVDAFLRQAKDLAPATSGQGRGRLVFALDATMSRQPTWDLACTLQAQMFRAAGETADLSVQLVYFRGFGECRASRWIDDARGLTSAMTGLDCRGGQTQIGRVLRHVRNEAARSGVKAFCYVGDAMEEPVDDLCAVAGELGLLGVKGFLFQEGHDPAAEQAFREMARLTGGAYGRFDTAAPETLAGLLRAAAAYAGGGLSGLRRLAEREPQARALLTGMGAGR